MTTPLSKCVQARIREAVHLTTAARLRDDERLTGLVTQSWLGNARVHGYRKIHRGLGDLG